MFSFLPDVNQNFASSNEYNFRIPGFHPKIFKKEDLKFGYRTTEGLDGEFVYKVHLNIEPDDKKSIRLKQKELNIKQV